jgi:D-3-phosphoglycerate dehydrogenase / 2-oxoglutarate reductase
MTYRVLVSTSSFLDTPGAHVDKLNGTGYQLTSARGPLSEQELINLITEGEKFDAFLCGEDEFSASVMQAAMPRIKVISKYGVGLDKIDVNEAQKLGIKVTNTPGVNHTTVTELTFGLLLALARKIPEQNTLVHRGEWRRYTGTELAQKTLGIFGFGRVGKEVAKRAMAFGMNVLVYNTSWSSAHSALVDDLSRMFSDNSISDFSPTIRRSQKDDEILSRSHFISLHMNLSRDNMHFLNRRRILLCRRGVYIINVSRGGLVDQKAMADAVRSGYVAGYAADVVDPEPIRSDNPLLGLSNVILTPHIGSRTHESVVRQGIAAVNNVINVLDG